MKKIILGTLIVLTIASANMCEGGVQYLEKELKKLNDGERISFIEEDLFNPYKIKALDKDGEAIIISVDHYVNGTSKTNYKLIYEGLIHKQYDWAKSEDVKLLNGLNKQLQQLKEILKISKAVSKECGTYDTVHFIGSQRRPRSNFKTKMHAYNYYVFYTYSEDLSGWGYPHWHKKIDEHRFSRFVNKIERLIEEIKNRAESVDEKRERLKKKLR